MQRHRERIRLGRPRKEKEIRYRSCNAETITTHFAALQKKSENSVGASRIFNVDESGSTATRGAAGRANKKRILRSGEENNSINRVPTFKNVDLVIIVPTVFENGETFRPLFIIKG